MPDYTDTCARLTFLLRNMVEEETALGEQTDLIDELQLDSVKVLDLVLEIEDEFDVTVPMNALADVRTLGDLARVIQRADEES